MTNCQVKMHRKKYVLTYKFSSDLIPGENLTSLLGEVIKRNLIDCSITLKCLYTNVVYKIFLPYWLKSQKIMNNTLPHTNCVILLKNINLVKTDNLILYYTGNEDTIIQVIAENCLKLLDNFLTIAEMLYLYESLDLNLLELLEFHKLTYEHLDAYIKLPKLLTHLLYGEVIHFNIFKVLTERSIMQNMNKEVFVIHTPSTVRQSDEILHNARNHVAPYFGNKPSCNECVVGIFVSKFGQIYLEDGKSSTLMQINSEHNSAALIFANALVLITKFHILTEIYNDGCSECIMVEIQDIFIIIKDMCKFDKKDGNKLYDEYIPAIIKSPDELVNYKEFEEQTFKVLSIAPANKVNGEDDIESWLLLEHIANEIQFYLCLGKHYLSTIAFLDLGRIYTLFTPNKLEQVTKTCNFMKRLNSTINCYKLSLRGAYFLPGFFDPNKINLLTVLPTAPATVNIKSTIVAHFLNKSKSFYTVPNCSNQVGMLATKYEHRLQIHLDGKQYSLYLNKWENKLTPAGLHPNVELLITNADYNRNYLSCNFMTAIKAVGITEDLKSYTTANLSTTQIPGYPVYESLVSLTKLNVKTYIYIRTLVYVLNFRGTINFHMRDFNCRFDVMDEKGCYTLTCNNYELHYKLMNIIEKENMEQYDAILKYKNTVNLTNIDTILKITELELLPLGKLWLLHCYMKFNYGLTSMDILCKKMLCGNWVIQDVFSVN